MKEISEVLRGLGGGKFHVTFPRLCGWCHCPVGQDARLCERCTKHTADKWADWNQQYYSRIEVLSIGAAEIVRSKFSKRAVREDFEFVLCGPEQMELGVWREIESGQETVDSFVLFTLAQTRDGKIKDYEKRFTRFWGGVVKLNKTTVVAGRTR